MSSSPTTKRAFFGLVSLKRRWCLTWKGWLFFFAMAFLGLAIVFWGIYPFLAVTNRIDANVLVVEGWVHDYVIRAGAAEFQRGAYSRVISTGGPVSGLGGYVNDYQTSASVGADRLERAGVPASEVFKVPSRVLDRDRTFSAAMALHDWFESRGEIPERINVLTENLHARRTRLLFQMALGARTRVGIISVPPLDYPQERWWRYSAGVKDVVAESAAYLYVRLFFWP